MRQIYKNIGTLILLNRNFPLSTIVSLGRDAFRIHPVHHRELTNKQRAFICSMVANQAHDGEMKLRYQLDMKFNWQMYTTRRSFYEVRQELIDLHVIAKVGNKHRYYLNPLYHPSLSGRWLREVEEGIWEAIKGMDGKASSGNGKVPLS